MPPEAMSGRDDMPIFDDYINSAYPCDDLFFTEKGEHDIQASPLLRSYSEERCASFSPGSTPSVCSKDDSTNDVESDISMAIKQSNGIIRDSQKDTTDIPSEAPQQVTCKEVTALNAAHAPSMDDTVSKIQPLPVYQLNLHGIPSKSRVETQIRLGLQVVSISVNGNAREESAIGDRFQWLKLPSWAMAKEKLKLQNRRDAPATIDPNSIVFLDARVVKSTEPLEDVAICSGCVTRERKRAQRKKDPSKRSPSTTGEPSSKLDPPELIPLPDENKKILVFNCPELLKVTNGEVVIPTRVTCYCRHHKEKDGFRIIVTLRDALNNILASTSSELVLITDDHKTTGKVQRVKDETTTCVKGQPYIMPQSKPHDRVNGLAEPLKPESASSQISSSFKPLSRQSSLSSHATSSKKRKAESSAPVPEHTSNGSKIHRVPDSLSMTNMNAFRSSSQHPMSYNHTITHRRRSPTSSQGVLKRSPSQDSLLNFMTTSAPHSVLNAATNSPIASASLANSVASPDQSFFDTSMDELMHDRTLSMSPRGRTWDYVMDTALPQDMQQSSTIIMPPTPLRHHEGPVISRMIPAEGPLRGGIEVTILGNGFHPGMTALFGETAAIPTHCWSTTTLVCVLPPSTNAGPVPVTFKEQPLSVGAKMFTYVDETDRTLYELALQVIGLKTTGRLETARDVAMRICSSKLPSESVDVNFSSMPTQQLRLALGLTEDSPGTEELIIKCLKYLDGIDNERSVRISHRTRSGHTMLHLAIIKRYKFLVEDLLNRGINVNLRDRASFTALHLAALHGQVDTCQLLLQRASINLSLCTSDGRTAYDLAAVQDDPDLIDLLDPWAGITDSRSILAHAVQRSRSSSTNSYTADSEETFSTLSETASEVLEAKFSCAVKDPTQPLQRAISSRSRGTRTQPTSRSHSPERFSYSSKAQQTQERHRSRSVNNLAVAGLSTKQIQALADEAKAVKALQRTEDSTDVQHVMNNILQLQQTWMAFLSETSPAWLQKTLANANASLPEVLKTPPNLAHHMQFSSSPISAFQAMLPNMPHIRPLSKTPNQEGEQARPDRSVAPADSGWLQNLVSSLGAPPTYAEAISAVTNQAEPSTLSPSSTIEEASTSSEPVPVLEHSDRRPEMLETVRPTWFGRSLTMPFRSQGRVAEMTPEQQRAQVVRFQKPADRMMFFFWLPCLMFFIAISIGKAFFDKMMAFIST